MSNWLRRAWYRHMPASSLICHVPTQFGISCTVPLLKESTSSYNKNLTTDDFRGISIRLLLSKIFEHCVLRRFELYFKTSDNQFGFKKHLGCSRAIYTVRYVVSHYISNGSTVNVCAIDISKAFDRVNRFGLLSRRSRQRQRLSASVLSICLSVCRQNAKKRDFLKN